LKKTDKIIKKVESTCTNKSDWKIVNTFRLRN